MPNRIGPVPQFSELIAQGKLKINNIQELENVPEMKAGELKKQFDQSVDQLVKAFDEEIQPYIASTELVDNIEAGEGESIGDMKTSAFASQYAADPTIENAHGKPVDRALYADSAANVSQATRAINDGDNANIASTYQKKSTLAATVINLIYPVGSLYITTKSANPATYLGIGEWEAWGQGRVPVGVDPDDADYAAGNKKGGAKERNISHTHTVSKITTSKTALTTRQIPSHTHTFTGTEKSTDSVNAHTHTVNSSGAHSHTVVCSRDIHQYKVGSGEGSSYKYWSSNYDSSSSSANKIAQTFSAKSDGSSHTHTLAVNGGHNHKYTPVGTLSSTGSGESHTHDVESQTTGSGGTTTLNIRQPWITCYMWKRVG